MRKVIASAALVLTMMLGAVPEAVAAPPSGDPCSVPIGAPMARLFITPALIFIPTDLDAVNPSEEISLMARENRDLGNKVDTAISVVCN